MTLVYIILKDNTSALHLMGYIALLLYNIFSLKDTYI